MATRSIAVLKLNNKVKSLITFAQSVATSMLANPISFPSPTPTLVSVQADINALITAETAVLARTKGAVEIRNAKLAVVKSDLDALKGYVQAMAVLRGEMTLDEAVAAAQQGHRNYAKRQGTWFRKEREIEWVAGFGGDAEVVAWAKERVERHLAAD